MRLDVKIQGFAPDLEIGTPGIILTGGSYVPTINGVGPARAPIQSAFPALAASCRGAVVVRKIDDTTRFIVGTQTKLYEGTSSYTYTDQSAGGGSYTGAAESLWRFTQFGNDTIATNKVDAMQVSSSTTFAALGGTPPKASLVETCNNFVIAFDYNDGTNDYPDGWWCCALGNDASWSPSIATQAANGRLRDSPGKIFAAKRLGDVMAAYKQRSMYLGFNDGPPAIWRWQLVPGDVGCVSQEAIQSVIVNDIPAHVFAGYDGFYLFDGTRPKMIGKELRGWYNQNVPAQYRYRIKSLHDRAASRVTFYLPDSTGNLNYAVVYNYRADRWGYLGSLGIASPIVMPIEYITGGVTYDGLGALYATYDDLPTNISYDSPLWSSAAPLPAVYGAGNFLYTLSGAMGNSSFQAAYSGDVDSYQTITRIRPRFNIYPSGTNYVDIYTAPDLGATPSLDDNSGLHYPLSDNKYDMLISSRFFSPLFTFPSTDFEMTGYSIMYEMDGEE